MIHGLITPQMSLSFLFPGSGYLKPEDDRLRRLERENEILRRERDILKKAMAIFSSP